MTSAQWAQSQQAVSHHAFNEYRAQLAAHCKRRARSTFRYIPPSWHDDAVAAMGADDYEEVFSALTYR